MSASKPPPRRQFIAFAVALSLVAATAWVLWRKRAAAPSEAELAARAAAARSPPPSSAPPAPAPSSSAPSAAQSLRARDAAHAALCQPILDANSNFLLGKPKPEGSESFFKQGCIPTPSGAWALRIDSWEKVGEWAGTPSWRGAFTVVHLSADGGRPAETRPARVSTIQTGVTYTKLEIPERIDIDRDGAPEILLVEEHKEHEGPWTTSVALLTYRNGAVVEYPGLPGGYRAILDTDSDGLLDVVYYPYAQIRGTPCSGFGYEVKGPSLLAHGQRDGTFSLDDPAAVAFARRSCSTTVESDRVDPELCARLSGASAGEALSMLRQACRPPAAGDDGCDPAEGVCYDYAERARLLKATPPLRIGP
jgi:hypothetical protein